MFEHGFPEHWSTLKKLIWIIGAGITGGGEKLVTVKGELVTFIANSIASINEIIVELKPKQSGSGDPSPTNIRQLTAYTSVNIYQEDEYDETANPKVVVTIPEDAGNVGGGELTIHEDGSATLVKKYSLIDGGKQTWNKISNSDYGNFYFTWANSVYDRNEPTVWSSNYKSASYNYGASAYYDNYIWIQSVSGSKRCTVKDTANASKTASQFKTAMNGVQIVGLLAEDKWTTYEFTAEEVQTLIGSNYIWTDAVGNVSVVLPKNILPVTNPVADLGKADSMTLMA